MGVGVGVGCWPVVPEEPAEAEMTAVKLVWEPLLSSSLAANLFPTAKFGTCTYIYIHMYIYIHHHSISKCMCCCCCSLLFLQL